MTLQKTLLVCILSFSDGVCEPLKLLLTTSDPDEVHLEGGHIMESRQNTSTRCGTYSLALDTSSNAETMDKLLQNRGKWCHSNTTAHQYGNIIAVPVLMSFTERSVQVQLGEWLSSEYRRVNALPQVVGPGADHTDVETEILLVRGRGDGERMVLSWVKG